VDKASQALTKPVELEAEAMMDQSGGLLNLDDFRFDDSSFLPYDFGLPSDDTLNYEPGKVLDGPLPDGEAKPDNGLAEHEGDGHDKRKVPDDDNNIKEGDAKRREGDEKTTKKPGRKPLMSEPTTVSIPISFFF
jgi:AP-1-like factor